MFRVGGIIPGEPADIIGGGGPCVEIGLEFGTGLEGCCENVSHVSGLP